MQEKKAAVAESEGAEKALVERDLLTVLGECSVLSSTLMLTAVQSGQI